jgi:hypothetical protein
MKTDLIKSPKKWYVGALDAMKRQRRVKGITPSLRALLQSSATACLSWSAVTFFTSTPDFAREMYALQDDRLEPIVVEQGRMTTVSDKAAATVARATAVHDSIARLFESPRDSKRPAMVRRAWATEVSRQIAEDSTELVALSVVGLAPADENYLRTLHQWQTRQRQLFSAILKSPRGHGSEAIPVSEADFTLQLSDANIARHGAEVAGSMRRVAIAANLASRRSFEERILELAAKADRLKGLALVLLCLMPILIVFVHQNGNERASRE